MFDQLSLRQLALSKRHPEFTAEVNELRLIWQHAARMHQLGKLSDSKFAEVDPQLCGLLLKALPIELFDMEDGSLDDMQALSGHDGTRNVYDVEDERAAILKEITADLIDDAWLSQSIDTKTYAEESRKLDTSEELDDRLADGDYEGAASGFFARRNEFGDSDHDNQLLNFIKDKYGDAPSADKPPGYVDHQTQLDITRSSEPSALDGIIDLDAE